MWNKKTEAMWMKASMSKSRANTETLKWAVPLQTANKDTSDSNPLTKLVDRLLEKYLYWCNLRYSIAFFQWRKKFKVKPADKLETEEER